MHAMMMMNGWSWEIRIRIFISILLGSSLWVRLSVVRCSPGMPRLVAALPVILLLYLAPLLFDPVREIFTVITAAYLSARMPATKVRWQAKMG